MDKSTLRTVFVVGNDPTTLLDKYDANKQVDQYIKYRYLDAAKMHKSSITAVSNLLSNADKIQLNKFQKDYFQEKLKALKSLSDFEYYRTVTDGLYYDEEGNALTTENPNGKWKTCKLGGNFSYPLITNTGAETYQAKKGEVEWELMHMRKEGVEYFRTLWELVKEGRPAKNDEEKALYDGWKSRENYLSNFKDMDALIAHNCMYWCYAILNKDGWHSIDDEGMTETEWITTFYDKYIANLPDDELISVYEFSLN